MNKSKYELPKIGGLYKIKGARNAWSGPNDYDMDQFGFFNNGDIVLVVEIRLIALDVDAFSGYDSYSAKLLSATALGWTARSSLQHLVASLQEVTENNAASW